MPSFSTMTRYIIFDTETTGVAADKKAVEIALMEIDDQLNVLGECDSLINPECPISPEAQAVHGISLESLQDCPTIEQWVANVLGGPLEGEVTLIGHRVGFDLPLFAPIGNAVRTLDTLPLAFEYISQAPNKKLATLREYLGFEPHGDSHRAMADVWDCLSLTKHLCEITERTLEELITTPYDMHYMPWGKHTGMLLHEVPRGYREHILGFPDLDPNLRRALQRVALMDPPRRQVVLGAPRPKRTITIAKRKFT